MHVRVVNKIMIAIIGVIIVGCGGQPDANTSMPSTVDANDAAARQYPYQIVTTTAMVNDIVHNVAGDKAVCTNIIGAGVDPHLYKATVGDIKKLQRADVIFYSGLMLEGKMADALIRVANAKPVYAVTQLVDETYLLQPDEFDGHYDPHLWMDVNGWMKAVDAVNGALAKYDSENADYYASNTTAYLDRLSMLDAYANRVISSIPEKSRVLITAHDAFNYLGRAYSLEVLGIQGLSTESEAGMRDIERLVNLLVQRNIKAVFPETSVPSNNIAALKEGAKAKGHTIAIGGALFSDAMGSPGTYEGTYIGMIDHNVTTIARGLGGEAPERGMQGKLSGVGHD